MLWREAITGKLLKWCALTHDGISGCNRITWTGIEGTFLCVAFHLWAALAILPQQFACCTSYLSFGSNRDASNHFPKSHSDPQIPPPPVPPKTELISRRTTTIPNGEIEREGIELPADRGDLKFPHRRTDDVGGSAYTMTWRPLTRTCTSISWDEDTWGQMVGEEGRRNVWTGDLGFKVWRSTDPLDPFFLCD